MKKMMMVLGVLLCATLLVNPAMACDGKDAKQGEQRGRDLFEVGCQGRLRQDSR